MKYFLIAIAAGCLIYFLLPVMREKVDRETSASNSNKLERTLVAVSSGKTKVLALKITHSGRILGQYKDQIFLSKLMSELSRPTMPFLDYNVQGKRIYNVECTLELPDGVTNHIGELNIFKDRIYLSLYLGDDGYMDSLVTIRLDDIQGEHDQVDFSQMRSALQLGSEEFPKWPR
jgi:hypothetical protein